MRSAIGVGVLVVLLAVVVYWLLTTLGGRGFLLSQVSARLPEGTTLTWQRAEGPVSGPMTLHGVRFVMKSCPEKDGKPVPYGECLNPGTTTFTARRVTVDPDIRPLFGKLLRLDAMDVEGATLDLPKTDTPFELPRWPDVLPQIELPLGLQADTLRIDGFKVTSLGETTIDIRTLRGGLDARDGKLHLEHVVIDSDRGRFTAHGDYDPRRNYATDLTVSALLPAPIGRTRPRFGLVARGTLDKMDVSVAGSAPDPIHAAITLRGDDPRWTITADSTALDPGLLAGGAPGTPLAFDIRGNGVGGDANLQGKLVQGDLVVVLQPSKLRIEDQVLELKPLIVDTFGGRITAKGKGDFNDPANASFKFAVIARDLVMGGQVDPDAPKGTEPAPPVTVNARLGLAGTTADWAAVGQSTLVRDGEQATVDFDGRGDAQQLALKTVHVAMPTGTLDATGQVVYAPALGWTIDARLAGFDPGYFAGDFKGAVNAAIASTGSTRADGGLEVQGSVDQLGGNLRGRKLGGRATFAMHGAATGQTQSNFEGELALSLGDSRIDAKGSATDALDIDATLTPLQLADLLPNASGSLRGTLNVTGKRDAPDLIADLAGRGLKYGTNAADSLIIKGNLPWASSNGRIAIEARGVNAGVLLDSVRVNASGAVENLKLDASARGEIGALDLSATAVRRGALWQGALSSLALAPTVGASWRLQAPARYAQTSTGFTLNDSCFASSAGGSLCANADWPRRGVALTGNKLPLALAVPYLPKREDGRPWVLRGEIALDAKARPSGSAYAGNLNLRSSSGGLKFRERARNDVISYDNLALDATFDAQKIAATLKTVVNDSGRIDARVQTGWSADSALAGDIAMDIDKLTWMELFSPDILDPTGQITGRIALSGTRAAPLIGGQAELSNFTTEVPSLGIVLEKGNMRLDALADGTAKLAGSIVSGGGTLTIDGSLGWRVPEQGDTAQPLVLNIKGSNVAVADTRQLKATASPDLVIRAPTGQPLSVSGTVTVPSALIDLEHLESGVSASSDVVVLDPVKPEEASAASALDLDLTLVMGDDVKLKGLGLEGTLGGQMRVRSVPGREMTAFGELQIGGRYKAYGQELQITRGQLQWSNGPVDDPILDIRAERKIDTEDITAGVDVTGRASAPEARVYTDPASSQSEALSYLALGRSTSNLSSEEGEQLNAASAALNAGGSLLAARLGKGIGLDNAGISSSRALGGSVLGIGKKLSPRLYVGFGVSLLGTGQVLTLKYLLGRGFDTEIESSTLENRGSINYRKER